MYVEPWVNFMNEDMCVIHEVFFYALPCLVPPSFDQNAESLFLTATGYFVRLVMVTLSFPHFNTFKFLYPSVVVQSTCFVNSSQNRVATTLRKLKITHFKKN